MPVVLRFKGYRFFFYSNEGDPLEPVHVHVRKGKCLAKFWIKARVEVVESYGFNSNELSTLLRIIKQNAKLIERSWNEYFYT